MISRSWKTFLVVGMLITGTGVTLTKKFQLECCGKSWMNDTSRETSVGQVCPQGEEKFTKPWFQNLIMFIGESLLLVLVCLQGKKSRGSMQADFDSRSIKPLPPFSVFGIPAACDVLGTGVAGVGLIFVSASVWQMMRGSVVIFTSIFSIVFLRRKLYTYHWLSVGITVCGITLVGVAAIMDEGGMGNSSGDAMLGIVFIVLGQAFSAFQAVTEELFLKAYREAPAAKVVGNEGIWGIIFMILLLAVFHAWPGSDNGSYENSVDTVYKIVKSPMPLDLLCIIYVFCMSCYNFFGVTITGHLSSIHRSLIDALRTATVWVVELGIYYATKDSFCSPAGQSRGQCFGTNLGKWSLLQFIGFLLLTLGTFAYNSIIKIPGCYYPPPGTREKPISAEGFASPVEMLFSPVTRMLSPVFRMPQSPMSPECQAKSKVDLEELLLTEG